MKLSQLLDRDGFTLMNAVGDRDVTGGICGDLLSWVMARGKRGMAWVTVQTHMNVVAVASLHEFSCVILADGCVMDEEALRKAETEAVAIVIAPHPAYAICGILHDMGV